MGTSAVAAREYWGYLINPDRTPTPIFEQLLLGVANYINRHIAPWDTNCLIPTKLATFYRLVGGDYDTLFLDTPEQRASLSFIYQSMGCFHTLQPEKDPYVAPKIPALTPHGFVRWQTIQLLMDPEVHVAFLQNAVKRFDLINPADGVPFPSILPKETLPTQSDPEMIEWHESVLKRLMLEAQASAARELPPRPKLALSDIDVDSSRDSSIDSHSVTNMASYRDFGPRGSHRSQTFANGRPSIHLPPQYMNDAPWSPERRRNSMPDSRRYPAPWPLDGPTPTSSRSFSELPLRNSRPHHVRADSDLSTISTSTDDSSSITTSSASMSPVRYHGQLHLPVSPGARRHSTHLPPQRPASHPQSYLAPQRKISGPSGTKNVRWQDMDDVFDRPRCAPASHFSQENKSTSARELRSGDRDWEERERGRGRSARPMTGVGGRRYPEGVRWR